MTESEENGCAIFHAQVTVDMKSGALYIQLADVIEEGEVAVNEIYDLPNTASEVVFDLNDHGELLGIEIVGIDGLLKGHPDLVASKTQER